MGMSSQSSSSPAGTAPPAPLHPTFSFYHLVLLTTMSSIFMCAFSFRLLVLLNTVSSTFMCAFSFYHLVLLSTMSSILDVRFQLPLTCVAEHNVKHV